MSIFPAVRPAVSPAVRGAFEQGSGGAASIIAGLFSAGQQGFWLPFTDFASLTQDSAGTLPYTALEQPVGRVLDRSGRGNHASQPTSTARGVVSARVNLLEKTEFANGVLDAPTRGGLLSATTMDGYAGALAFGGDGSTTTYAYKNKQLIAGMEYVMTVDVIMDDGDPPVFTGTVATGSGASFVMVVGGYLTPPAQVSVTPIGGGVYRVKAQVITTAVNLNSGVAKYGVQTRTFKVSAYDLRPASLAGIGGAYQRVNTPTDYDSVGYPKFLLLDGTDDSYTCGGGGSTTGFYYSDVIRPMGGAGTARFIMSDRTTGNVGIMLTINAANKLELAVGNTTTYVRVSSAETLAVGTAYWCEALDDGVNLQVRVNNGAPVSVPRPTPTAGGSTLMLYKHIPGNDAIYNGQATEPIYRAGPPPSAYEREVIRNYQMQKAGML